MFFMTGFSAMETHMSQKAKYGVKGAAKVRQRRRRLDKKMNSSLWLKKNNTPRRKGKAKKEFMHDLFMRVR